MPWTQKTLLAALTVRPAGDDVFEATLPPSDDEPRVFGGSILGLAANAALRTVEVDRLSFHSLHAHFLRPASDREPFELQVERWRDGRSFATRHITVSQAGRRCATATASFHIEEAGDEYQLPVDRSVPSPDGLPADEWCVPFDAREAGPVMGESGVFRSTRRVWLRLPEPLPDDPVVHATLAAYVSDMTGSSFRPLSLGEWGTHTDASIDHAMWLHRPFRLDAWVLYDLHAVINTGGRSLVRGSMFDEHGNLCLTIAQELLIRKL